MVDMVRSGFEFSDREGPGLKHSGLNNRTGLLLFDGRRVGTTG